MVREDLRVQTFIRTPQEIFYLPQLLQVPLFQRPYVWSKEAQWQPLWADVQRLADRLAAGAVVAPHFLGAVVIQQLASPSGRLTVRSIIDGQQRLTTLQLLTDAVHDQLELLGHSDLALQLQDLTENPSHFRGSPADRFKVVPTNRDRAAFSAVMAAAHPVDYGSLAADDARLTRAHEYFTQEAAAWLADGDSDSGTRAAALTDVLANRLLLASIELQYDEDAQEIFETLNARGTPLTAADLIKNFVFQRLEDSSVQEDMYHRYWAEFETPFWETEVQSGRVLYSRSSLFLNQWLIAQTGEDVPAREVFAAFKRYVVDNETAVETLVPALRASADTYRSQITASQDRTHPLGPVELFVYRSGTLESEVFKPLLIWLTDPGLDPIGDDQLTKAVASLESWMVRRALVRATTKSYNRFLVDLLAAVNAAPRSEAGDTVERFLASQSTPTSYWPGNNEVKRELENLPVYQRYRRGRLRMLLEAAEDHRRGFTGKRALHEQPVIRATCSIEHVLPQEWRKHWSAALTDESTARRNTLLQTLGNLTLVTQALNSRVSNGPWAGPAGKRAELEKHTSILLTRDIVKTETWDEEAIQRRTRTLVEDFLAIWTVPADLPTHNEAASARSAYRVEVADLVRAGFLAPGQTLYARPQAHAGSTGAITEDGRIWVHGSPYDTPSAAARAVTGAQSEAGWWFWLLEPDTDQSLSTARDAYLSDLDEDVEEADLAE